MNIIPLGKKCYYVVCHVDNIAIEIPADSSEIKKSSTKSIYYTLLESKRGYIGYINCPNCGAILIINSRDSDKYYRSMYVSARQEQSEKRITQIEYSPPPQGGSTFNEILREAVQAGDFTNNR